MKSYAQIAIRTKSETVDLSVGEKLIDTLSLCGGLLVPEQVSHNADRITDDFSGKILCENVWASRAEIRSNGVLSEFYQDFAWKRKKVIKSSGSVVHTSKNNRGQIVPGSVSLNAAPSDKVDWYLLFKAWCEIFPPQLGMLHIFTTPELSLADRTSSFQLGSFNSALKPDIPNIGWGMFYGDEFSKEVNADKIEESGFPIEKLGSGYLVRVTESIEDVINDFSFFSNRRTELRSLFRDDFFLVNQEPVS